MNAIKRLSVLLTGMLVLWTATAARGDDPAAKARPTPKRPRPKITISKETTHISGPLRKDGFVDYVAAINDLAGKGVKPEDNAAVLLWQAFGPAQIPKETRDRFSPCLGMAPLPEHGDYFISFEAFVESHASAPKDGVPPTFEQLDTARVRPWSKDEFPVIAAWLEQNAKPMALIVEASKRTRYYSPYIARHEGILLEELPLPTVVNLRELARAFSCRAMLRVKDGRIEEAWQDVHACHRLGRLGGQAATLVEWLVSVAVHHIVRETDAALAHYGHLSAEQANRFCAELQRLPPLVLVVEKIDFTDRCQTLDAASLMAREGIEAIHRLSDEVQKTKPLTAEERETSLAMAALVDWDETLRVANHWYDRAVEAARKPTRAERSAALGRLDEDIKALGASAKMDIIGAALTLGLSSRMNGRFIGKLFVVLMVPANGAAVDASDRLIVLNEMSRTVFALAAYRAEHKEYPENLADLAPRYLPAVPNDLFAGAPLHYRREASGYVLYSVGRNGKDDGGRDYREPHSAGSSPPDDEVIRMPVEHRSKK